MEAGAGVRPVSTKKRTEETKGQGSDFPGDERNEIVNIPDGSGMTNPINYCEMRTRESGM